MPLIDAFKTECVAINSTAQNKSALLEEIAATAKKCTLLADIPQETILSGLRKREELGSTGFQDGIAIPHCLIDSVSSFVVGLITHSDGVDFSSFDKKPTYIIPFIIGPKTERNTHIRILSAISRILNNETVRKELLQASSPTALSENFLKNLGNTFKTDASNRRNLAMVHIQNESLFEDILQLFSEAQDCHISVLDAHDCSEYLNAMPLFAAFWSDNKRGFHRIIFASIHHSMANEILRRLDTLVGGLENDSGVFVQLQDSMYTAGSLDM